MDSSVFAEEADCFGGGELRRRQATAVDFDSAGCYQLPPRQLDSLVYEEEVAVVVHYHCRASSLGE